MAVVNPFDTAVTAASMAVLIAATTLFAEELPAILAVVIDKLLPLASTKSKLIVPVVVAGVVTVIVLLPERDMFSPFPVDAIDAILVKDAPPPNVNVPLLLFVVVSAATCALAVSIAVSISTAS